MRDFPKNPKKFQGGFIAAALAAVSIVSSLTGAKKQKKANRKSNELARFQGQQARLDAVREYRLARAAVLQGTVASGAQTSSARQGIQGSLLSQLQNNLEIQQVEQKLGGEIRSNQARAANYSTIAGLASLGSDIAKGVRTVTPQTQGTPSTPTTSPTVNSSPFLRNPNAS